VRTAFFGSPFLFFLLENFGSQEKTFIKILEKANKVM
jgi:hypothetical protein